jgi:filamentous hemagglutinin family protein
MLNKKQCLRYIFLASIFASAHGAYAQSITPANDGLNTNVNQVGNQYNITGGTQAGANLFYSLQKLGLSTSEVANFLSNPSVQNVLTRVTGGEASLINGLIQMTGGNSNLFILNPAGIVFGANASLNVPANFSAMTATGIQVGNGWFGINSSVDEVRNLTGNITGYGFTNTLPSLDNSPSGVISNEGNLQTNIGKSITLVGGMVVNTGTIATPEGNITITATPDNKFIKITNEGSLMSLELPIANQQVVGNAPVLRGVDLPSLLIGKTSGTAIVSGNLDVSGNNGGNIQVLGDNVGLVSANINANGINGGGTVLIGGDLQGTGTTLTSLSTTVDANSKINVDALTNGNGGKVIVWADDITKFDGTITAKSGTQSGNGGLVETSGKNTLIVGNTAQVNTSSPQGLSGNWLLDPTSITVVAAGGIDPDVATANANAGASTIDSAVIVTALGVGNVTLTATNLITVDAAINSVSGNNLALNAPTINLNAPITLTGTLAGNSTTVNVGAAGTVKNGVDAANSGATVNLAASTYTLAETVLINKSLTLNGAGANNTIISGNNAVQIFNIGNNITVNINDLTVAEGRSVTESGGANIADGSTLNLNRTIFSGNFGNLGAAIFNPTGGILNVDNSIFSNNSANAGSGIATFGTATVSNSTFSNNSANIIGAFYSSGGISTISNSTFSGNTLINRAGAAVLNEAGTTNISNSTFSGNSTGVNGRGIIFNFSGTTNISNSTVFGNTPNPQGAIFTEGGTTNIANSIILGNSTVGNPEIFVTDRITPVGTGTINFTGTNIVGADGTSGISISGNGTVTGVTPITPTGAASTVISTTLANNGSLTQTFALVPDSIAIDASSTTGGAIPTTSDQRGILTVNGTRDIGAFETRGFTLTPINGTTPQSTTVNTLFGNLLGVAVSFDSVGSVDGRTVAFTAPNTLASGLFGATSTTTATITGGIATAEAFRANSTSGTYNVTATVTGSTAAADFRLTNTSVVVPPAADFRPTNASIVIPPVVTSKPDIDPNKETRRHDEKKVLVLPSLTPIAFLSADDIEFQRFDKFLIAIVEFMNKDGGDLVINANEIWKDADISIINESSNQEVIKLAIRRLIGKFIGNEYIDLVDVTFETKKDKKNILLKVRKSPKFARFLND